MQYDTRARLLAVEVLLTDPEALGNDALETDLYLLRDQLTSAAGPGEGLALRPARGVSPAHPPGQCQAPVCQPSSAPTAFKRGS